MSDERVRDLERRWKLSGDATDEAAWLGERLRLGRIELARVELAAHCGHDAALSVLGSVESPAGKSTYQAGWRSSPSVKWAERLESWSGPDWTGRQTVVRGFLGLARVFQKHWTPLRRVGDLEPTLRAIEDWVLCPCDDHRRRAVEGRVTTGGRGWQNLGTDRRAQRAGRICEVLAVAVGMESARGLFPLALPDPGGWATESDADLREAIGAELRPWALGYSDPVRERVTRRQ